MVDIVNGSKEIKKCLQIALEEENGALIGRNGSTELHLMIDINESSLYSALSRNAGIFPLSTRKDLLHWQEISIKATKEADILATGWYKPLLSAEQTAFTSWKVNAIQIPLRSLEPYYVTPEDQWTQCLSGHRVAVVSSFTQTMKHQVNHLDKIWNVPIFPRDIHWSWVQCGYAPSIAKGRNEWPSSIHRWTDAVDSVVSKVIENGARFALIGCGGLSMPIAMELKRRGIIAIVLGGAIQVLFGIKGERWKSHEIISKFWNESWVWPSDEETPMNACTIENGCYWKN